MVSVIYIDLCSSSSVLASGISTCSGFGTVEKESMLKKPSAIVSTASVILETFQPLVNSNQTAGDAMWLYS